MSKVLIIGKVWPEPNSSAAGTRIMQLISCFLQQRDEITFVSAASISEYSVNLSEFDVSFQKIELNSSSFNVFLKELNPDIVVFDRYMTEEQFGWRVAHECPNALRILDTEDLHCLRSARQKALRSAQEVTPSLLLSEEMAKREVASIYRCDISLMISLVEMEVLKNTFGVDEALLLHLPFMSEPISSKEKNAWPSFEQRHHFITIGNFLHAPNWDSVHYLKKDIWPLIHAILPKAEMHVYGAYPSEKVFQLHSEKDRFLIKGRAENATEVMKNARVCLAPLRFGAGLKGKLLQAMQCGTPSVTTNIGAESMHSNLPWSGEIGNTSEKIAEAAIKLYTHEKQWQTAQKNGLAILPFCFNANTHKMRFVNHVVNVQNKLSEHRNNNFIGAMLMHHTMRSTEFMSRWIEAKNRP